MLGIERIDEPAASRINTHVTRPPENVAGAYVFGSNLVQRRRDVM
jgi:hypothetical protein